MSISKTSATKVAALALAGAMAFAMCACSSSKPADNSNASDSSPAASSTASNTSNTSDTENSNIAPVPKANAEAEGNANSEPADEPNANAPFTATLQNTFDAPGYLNRIPSLEDKETPRVPDFQINGIALTGNQHDSNAAYAQGYLTEGIMSDFNLNEWLYIYFDDSSIPNLGYDTSIIMLPHQDVETYKIAQKGDLSMMAENAGGFTYDIIPEMVMQENGLNMVASGFVSMDEGREGAYDVLICKGEIPAYYVVVNMGPAV